MRSAADLADVWAVPLQKPEAPVEPGHDEICAIGEHDVESDRPIGIDFARPEHDPPQPVPDRVERIGVGITRQKRHQVHEDVLAVGLALDVVAMDAVGRLQQTRPHPVEIGNRSVVREYVAAQSERVRVVDVRRTDGRPPHVRDDGARVDARRLLREPLSVEGGPGLLLHDRHAIGIVGDAPSVAVHQSLGIAFALRHQGVLRADQSAFDTRRLVGAKGV